MFYFNSDYTEGAHPQVLQALIDSNMDQTGGYGEDKYRKHKIKSREEVSNASELTPEWFNKGIEAALLAPTAVNQQKFFFELLNEKKEGKAVVKASTTFSMIGYTKMDLGIAKYHFEAAAGKDNFVWA